MSWFKRKPKVYIETFDDKNGKPRWRLRSPNGEIIGMEAYSTNQMRDKTVDLLCHCRIVKK